MNRAARRRAAAVDRRGRRADGVGVSHDDIVSGLGQMITEMGPDCAEWPIGALEAAAFMLECLNADTFMIECRNEASGAVIPPFDLVAAVWAVLNAAEQAHVAGDPRRAVH